MCACMCACVYVCYIYTHIHVICHSVCIHVYVCICTKQCTCVCICIYICMYVYINTCVYMCIYIHIHMSVCIYMYTHMYVYIYIYIHICWSYRWFIWCVKCAIYLNTSPCTPFNHMCALPTLCQTLFLQAAEVISSWKLAQSWFHVATSLRAAMLASAHWSKSKTCRNQENTTGWPSSILPSRVFANVCVCACMQFNIFFEPLILEQPLHCKHNITKLCSTQRN